MHAITKQITTLAELERALRIAKASEKAANAERLAIEQEILNHPDVALLDEGTTTAGNLKIETGYTRKFDQAKLVEIAEQIPAALWPFEAEYKEVRKGSRYLEQNEPELWAVISQALTLTPRKPAITIKEPKQ